MARKFLVPIDMNLNEILNVIFQNVATLPATVQNGRPLYNTSDNGFYMGINGVWTDISGTVKSVTSDTPALTVDNTDPANPELAIADANTTNAGLLTSALFDLLTGATNDATANTLVQRDANGSATFEMVVINGTPTNPTDAATKAYVDNIAAAGLTIKGTLDASTDPDYPAGVVGDAYHISVAGKIGGASGVDVEVGDLIVITTANAGGDQATVGDDWIIMQTNVDQATTTVRGTIRIATQAEVDAGTSVDTAITPATLAVALDGLGSSETQVALIGDGVALNHAVAHTLSSQFVTVQTYDAATNEKCEADVTLTSPTSVTIATTTPISNQGMRVIITGTK